MKVSRAICLSIILLMSISLVIKGDDESSNREFGISEDCYNYYRKGIIHRNERVVFLYTDSLQQLSKAKGDDKAYVMSYLLPLYYYSNFNNYDNVKMAADTLRSVSKQYGYTEFYYHAYANEVSYLCNYFRYNIALRLARECSNEANRTNDKYGIFMSYKIMGDIYASQKLNGEALKSYRMALEYHRQFLSQYDVSEIFINMFDIEPSLSEKEAILNKASVYAASNISRARLKVRQLMFFGETYNKEQFMKKYYELQNDSLRFSTRSLPVVDVYYEMFNGNLESALAKANKNLKQDVELNVVSQIAAYYGDYKKAYDAQKQLTIYKDSLLSSKYLSITASFSEQMENDALNCHLRNKEIEAIDNKHKLQKASAEAEALKAKQEALEARDAKYVAERQRARAENLRNLTLLKRTQSEKALSKLKLRQMLMQSTIYFLVLFVLLLSIVIVVFIYYNIVRRRMVTELHESNEKLKLAQERAEEANHMKNLFVQNMNHEIRTPLNAVIGFSQLLSTPGIPLTNEERSEYANYIDTNGKMLTMLVDDVLNIADIENNLVKLKYSKAYVRDICDNAFAMVRYRIPINVELISTFDIAEDFMIYTDVGRLKQVLVNFLTNACKNTNEGSITLHVTDKASPDSITFSVTDTGIGIPKEERETIFERFKKLDPFKQGAGIGLNICLSIANLMNGMVWCDPDYDGGSRFLFELPLESPPEEK